MSEKNDKHRPHSFSDDPNWLLDVILSFNSKMDYISLLNVILTNMMEITSSDAGSLYVVEDGKLHFRILKNNSLGIFKIASSEDEIELPPVVLDSGNIENVSAYSAIHNEVVIIEDVYSSNEFNFSGPKKYDKITGYHSRSMLVLPLASFWKGEYEVLGVIQMLNATDPKTGEFVSYGDTYDANLVTALSKVAANVLANLIHIQAIHKLFYSFTAVLTQAIDERSTTTKYHTQNVANYCKAFAEYLSTAFPAGHPFHFDERHIERLTIAALLHDIGKIATPTHILDKANRLLDTQFTEIKYRFTMKKQQLEIECLKGNISKEEHQNLASELEQAAELVSKANSPGHLTDLEYEKIKEIANITYIDLWGKKSPILNEHDVNALMIRKGTLTDEEWTYMRDHVSATGRLLDKVTFWKYYGGVSKWARDHHEFLDGTGYPEGLTGDKIALETCIITIMDIFDALTAFNRPYRKGMQPIKALAVLHEMADDGKLHKDLVRAFEESKLWERLASK